MKSRTIPARLGYMVILVKTYFVISKKEVNGMF